MRTLLIIIIGLLFLNTQAQESLKDLLNKSNTKSVPYISVEELAMPKTKVVLLDAREVSEYKVSHLKNAIHIGYDFFNIKKTSQLLKDKSAPIVVYCSLGIRSEDVAEKLKKAGYTNVKNLYGGIFEWKNKKKRVYNSKEKETDSVHAFSKEWSKWLKNGIKFYPKLKKNER